MNTISIFMAPVARKFNLLRFFGNLFVKLRKEMKEINEMGCPKEGEFLSSMCHLMVVLMKVGILFFALTILPMAIVGIVLNNLVWIGQLIFIIAAADYFNACLETYDEEPEGDE